MHKLPPVFTGILLCAAATVAAAAPATGPGVREVVEFTQLVQPLNQSDDLLREQVSPDGTQAFIVTRKADVASDRNRYEIQLLDVRPEHLVAARAPAPVTIFAMATGDDNNHIDHAVQDVHWAGNGTLVFLARLSGRPSQVYRLDVRDHRLRQLTHEPNLIVSYAASQDLRRIVYAVQLPNPPQHDGEHDVVVGNQTFWSVKFGQQDKGSQQRIFQYFVADTASPGPSRALGRPLPLANFAPPIASISPDGRWALLPRYEPERLSSWKARYPMVAEASVVLPQVDPLGYYLRSDGYAPRRMTAWRLDDGREQTVVDAPDDALSGSLQFRRDRLWQGTGTSVVLGGTHLPVVDGGGAPSSHVIEYWPAQDRWVDIATLQGRLGGLYALADGFLVVDGEKRREFRRMAGGGWRETAGAAQAAASGSGPAWNLHVVQGLNQPPDVQAFGPAGRRVSLTRLNPQFDADTWGSMQPYAWRDAAGGEWEGGLMSGSGMDSHEPHPLLIQTYGFAPDRFYLDGTNTLDGASSAFAGRAFLRDGILVLALPQHAKNAPVGLDGRAAIEAFNEGVRGAVDALVKAGRVDPSRVGIMGWSATGEKVLNLVTFGDVPIRAATMADGDANTLFSYTVTYGFTSFTWAHKERYNEGRPFGDGLAAWVRNDPSLHTDCIHAAMRIETYGTTVHNNWDVYSVLRRQYKAADMIVIPSGRHSLGLPGDRMASLQGNVDWYGFWLAGRVRTEPLLASETTASVAARFADWRQMETLKAADDARPGCAR